jgi:VWFA-related protein
MWRPLVAHDNWPTFTAAALIAGSAGVLLSGSAQAPSQAPVFRAETEAVWVTATAIDRDGRLVTDLGRDDFEVLVDGAVQPINQFRSDHIPFALTVMFDMSGSLEGNLGLIRRAMNELINQFHPGDRANVGSFDTLPSISPRFSSNRDVLLHSVAEAIGAVKLPCRGPWLADLGRSQLRGASAIWDAVACGIFTVANDAETPRRVVVLITDGKDNSSITLQPEVHAMAAKYEVMVYVIAMVGTEGLNTGGLKSLAAETGGGYLVVNQQEDLSPTFARVAEELRRQYVMGYSASAGNRGGKLEIRVKREGIIARGRRATMTNLPVASAVSEAIAMDRDRGLAPMSYAPPPVPPRGNTVFDRAAANALRPNDLQQLGSNGLKDMSGPMKRSGLAWVKAGGVAADRTRRLQLATYVLDFLSVQDQVSYWKNNNSPASELMDWAAGILHTGPPDQAERLWNLAAMALLERFGASSVLESHAATALTRFPDEAQFKLANAVAADMQLWPQLRDERGFIVDERLLPKILDRYNGLLGDKTVGQEARLRLGYFELLRGRTPQALSHFEQAGVPEDPALQYTLHLFRGQALMSAGRLDDAVESFRGAVGVVPFAQAATLGLGAALVNRGRHNEAEAIVSRMLNVASAPFDPWTIYAFPAWRYWPDWREALRKAITP